MANRPDPSPDTGVAGRGVAAAVEFAALGAGLTLTIAVMARLPDWSRSLGAFQILYAVSFGFFALAALRLARYRDVPAAGVLVMSVALATRAALLPVTPTLSDDIYRYVWEGRVVSAGANPYALAPDDARLAPLRDVRVWPKVNHPELATIYPPAAEAGFALVARLSPTLAAMKGWILIHDVALIGVLLAWCGSLGVPRAAALVYAWNPLVLVEYAGSGHHEPTAMLFLALAFWLAARRPVLSGLALAVGALIKLAPLVALPFLIRRWNARGRAACLALLVPGLAWFWILTRGAASGLRAYWAGWKNNPPLFDALERVTGSYANARVVAIVALAVVTLAALALAWPAERATRAMLRAGVAVSPVLHPWYLGWLVMFEPLAPSAPWLLLTLTVTMNYGLLHAPFERATYHASAAVRLIEYGAPALLAVVLWIGRRSRHGDAHA